MEESLTPPAVQESSRSLLFEICETHHYVIQRDIA